MRAHDFPGFVRKSSVLTAPLFFGVVDASLERLSESATLMIASAVDDSLFADRQDGSLGCSLGEVFHLVEIGGVLKKKRREISIDLKGDCRP